MPKTESSVKICVAQTKPIKGDIAGNIAKHTTFIDLAVSQGGDCIVFPELSLTGYEPSLAAELAIHPADEQLGVFQKMSDTHHITIGVGIPTKAGAGNQISMVIFQPLQPRLTYSKQYLHPDEYPYFTPGQNPVILTAFSHQLAPAICYESLLPEHSENAFQCGADIYVASVAKSAKGVEKADKHFPALAKKYGMTVLMSNCIGPCDDFESAGNTSVWNQEGLLVGRLNGSNEGLLLIDTESGDMIEKTFEN
jgi:predicted amidohydrolase